MKCYLLLYRDDAPVVVYSFLYFSDRSQVNLYLPVLLLVFFMGGSSTSTWGSSGGGRGLVTGKKFLSVICLNMQFIVLS